MYSSPAAGISVCTVGLIAFECTFITYRTAVLVVDPATTCITSCRRFRFVADEFAVIQDWASVEIVHSTAFSTLIVNKSTVGHLWTTIVEHSAAAICM